MSQLRKVLHTWPPGPTAAAAQEPAATTQRPAATSSGAAAAGPATETNSHLNNGDAASPQLQPQQLQLPFRFVLPLSGTPPTAEVDIAEANTWTASPFYRLK